MSNDEREIPPCEIEIDLRRLCGNCVNGYIGLDGVYCRAFDQLIISEGVAEECPLFESW